MASLRMPRSSVLILLGYVALMLTGIAFTLLGLYLHTETSMIAGSLLGFYIGLFCPQVWLHLASYPNQIYRSEWLFIAITLSPVPFWLYAMFFLHLSDNHATALILPAATFPLALLLPSSKNQAERVPVWHAK